jgi:hypothetical protein
MQHRNWFPFILIGLTLLLALGIFAYQGPRVQETGSFAPADTETVVSTEQYREDVLNLFAQYADAGEYTRMYQELLVLSVPAGYQVLHLELAIAFDKLQSGDIAEGEARIEALRSAYPWLIQ